MKIKFSIVLLLVCFFQNTSAQMAYKLGFTYRQPQSIKSIGIIAGLDFKKNTIQLSSSHFWHTPVPNQTVNSLNLRSKGLYQSGISYLRKIDIKKISIGLGAGLSLVNGPRYYLVDYYSPAGYGIYRVEESRIPTLTLNMEAAYKSFIIITTYNTEVKSFLIGIGVRLDAKKRQNNKDY